MGIMYASWGEFAPVSFPGRLGQRCEILLAIREICKSPGKATGLRAIEVDDQQPNKQKGKKIVAERWNLYLCRCETLSCHSQSRKIKYMISFRRNRDFASYRYTILVISPVLKSDALARMKIMILRVSSQMGANFNPSVLFWKYEGFYFIACSIFRYGKFLFEIRPKADDHTGFLIANQFESAWPTPLGYGLFGKQRWTLCFV